VSQEPGASTDAHSIALVLRNQAAECRRLAALEPQLEKKKGFVGLAHSYELTARAILKKARGRSRG
jgi:hypothetical protein